MNKGFLFLAFITFFSINSFEFAQSNFTNTLQNTVDEPADFYSIQKNFNEYWNPKNVDNGYYLKEGIKTKAPGWKLYKRWEWFWEQRVNIKTGEFPKTNSAIEFYKNKEALQKTSSLNENWVNLGTNSSTGGYAGIGRINCIAFHPSNTSIYWVGSPSGGIWRTTNNGSSWNILNDNEAVLGVSDIAVTSDYATSNTLYIATGDRDGGSMWSLGGGQGADNVSVGILKSTDGGATWNTTGLSFTKNLGERIYRLLIHPSNNDILIASTSDGIYKTTDAGVNWTQKSLNKWIDMEFKPGDPTKLYASTASGYGNTYVNISTNTGEDWNYSEVVSNTGRAELAVTAANSSIVYLLVSNTSGGLKGVWKSTDSGSSFNQANTNTSENMLGYYSNGSGGTSGQGGYDLCIAASPTDANTVFIGGVNTWKSTDGGVTWSINNMWTSSGAYNFVSAPVAHADKHVLAFQNGTTLFEGNDGGIYKTTNGGTSWNDLSNGMVISQLYRIGVSQTNRNTVLTGLQDNGTKKFSGSWQDVYGGDGMECIIDHTSATSYMYVTYVRGEIQRNSNGFSNLSTTKISANIPGGPPTGAWVTPYIMDPTNATVLFAGYDKVWKTTDRGNSWSSASQVLSSGTKLRSLAVAPSNSNVLYAADLTNMWKTTDGGATNWSSVSLPANSNSLTYIAVHATNPDIVWITFGGYTDGAKIYESTNGGASWTNISPGLPNIPVMSIVHYKTVTSKNILFAATDLGVYAKNGTNNWEAYNSGLPNVVVAEIEIYYEAGGTDVLRAGTYGRGLWETEILAPLPVELTSFTGNVSGNKITLNWQTATELNNFGFEIQRKIKEDDSFSWKAIDFVKGNGTVSVPNSYKYVDDKAEYGKTLMYRLKQIDTDGQYTYSNVIEVEGPSVSSYVLHQNYPNPFNPSTKISFTLPAKGNVNLTVSNILGETISVLVDEIQEAGYYEVIWDAKNVSSGIYFYTLNVISESNSLNFSDTKKMIFLE